MTASAIIALAGLALSILGLIVKVWLARRTRATERAETGQRSAEQADDIRKRTQQASIDHEATIPRLDDTDLDAELVRLRDAVESGRKTRGRDL